MDNIKLKMRTLKIYLIYHYRALVIWTLCKISNFTKINQSDTKTGTLSSNQNLRKFTLINVNQRKST